MNKNNDEVTCNKTMKQLLRVYIGTRNYFSTDYCEKNDDDDTKKQYPPA